MEETDDLENQITIAHKKWAADKDWITHHPVVQKTFEDAFRLGYKYRKNTTKEWLDDMSAPYTFLMYVAGLIMMVFVIFALTAFTIKVIQDILGMF